MKSLTEQIAEMEAKIAELKKLDAIQSNEKKVVAKRKLLLLKVKSQPYRSLKSI